MRDQVVQISREQFPKDFIFGVADADLQVIGEGHTYTQENAELSEWLYFAEHSRKCFNNHSPLEGIDRYNRREEDCQLIANLGVSAYRTSVSMSRLLKRNGTINGAAIAWYRDYFEMLRVRNLRIHVTLYHWELPQFLAEKGGWQNSNTIDWLLKHTRAVWNELGDLIDEYYILNEPWCVSFLSYHIGAHAPGKTSIPLALKAAHNALLAQGAAYEELDHLDSSTKISTVLNLCPIYPASETEEDYNATRYYDAYFNRWFLDPMYKGSYPNDAVQELFAADMPQFGSADMECICIGKKLKTLGVNYYNGIMAVYDPQNDIKASAKLNPKGKTTGLDWPIFIEPHYPNGLYDLLLRLHKEYGEYGLKDIAITENGMALESNMDKNTGRIDDIERIDYVKGHLIQIQQALAKGIQLSAYFLWTLMDNYEWSHGYKAEACFGVVHVNRDNLERTPKESYHWYRKFLQSEQ